MEAVRSEPPEEQTNRGLATRMLLVGFAAIHTSSMVCRSVLSEHTYLNNHNYSHLAAELHPGALPPRSVPRVHQADARRSRIRHRARRVVEIVPPEDAQSRQFPERVSTSARFIPQCVFFHPLEHSGTNHPKIKSFSTAKPCRTLPSPTGRSCLKEATSALRRR